MPATLPPVLPPFDTDTESIAEAAQHLLDHGAQLKFLRGQNDQLARRQDALNLTYGGLVTHIDHLSSRLTVSNSLASLNARRLKKLLDHWQIEDVEDAQLIEAEAL